MIIVDTNVASALMKPSPTPAVQDWVRARRGDELYTTSITLAEIRYGIERLPAGRRRDLLKTTADDVFAAFEDGKQPDHHGAGVVVGDVGAAPVRGDRHIDGSRPTVMCR